MWVSTNGLQSDTGSLATQWCGVRLLRYPMALYQIMKTSTSTYTLTQDLADFLVQYFSLWFKEGLLSRMKGCRPLTNINIITITFSESNNSWTQWGWALSSLPSLSLLFSLQQTQNPRSTVSTLPKLRKETRRERYAVTCTNKQVPLRVWSASIRDTWLESELTFLFVFSAG